MTAQSRNRNAQLRNRIIRVFLLPWKKSAPRCAPRCSATECALTWGCAPLDCHACANVSDRPGAIIGLLVAGSGLERAEKVNCLYYDANTARRRVARLELYGSSLEIAGEPLGIPSLSKFLPPSGGDGRYPCRSMASTHGETHRDCPTYVGYLQAYGDGVASSGR